MEKQSTATLARAVLPAALVYGAFLLCTSVLVWGGYLAALPSEAGPELKAVGYFSCSFSFPLGFFAAAGISYIKPSAKTWRHPFIAAALVIVAGILLAAWNNKGGTLASIAIGGLFGFAGALLFCRLQETVARLDVFSGGMAVFAAAAVSAIPCLAFDTSSTPEAVWVVCFVCVPAVVAGCVAIEKTSSGTKLHPMFQTVPKKNLRKIAYAAQDLWKPFLCISFSAFLVGIIRADTLSATSTLSSVNNSAMAGLLVASAVLLAFWKALYERKMLAKLQLLIFPLIATSFLLLPFLSASSKEAFVSLVFVVFSITSSLMVVSCARTARSYVISPVLVYGVFAGGVYLFLACGALLSFSIGGMSNAGTMRLFAIALIGIYALSMTLMIEKRGNEKQHEQTGAASASAFFEQARTTTAQSSEGRTDSLSKKANIEERCAALSKRFILTPRESEIMSLLVHGRDVPFIAEELTLSKNTVRTHVKNIFLKTGVHSKQELIDLAYLFEL